MKHALLPPAPDGTSPEQDLVDGSLMPCGVGNVVGATVVAYACERIERALDFVTFTTATEALAGQMRYIPYGPARRFALEHIDAEMRRMLPTTPENAATPLEDNARWWAEHLDEPTRRFESWVHKRVMAPEDFPH